MNFLPKDKDGVFKSIFTAYAILLLHLLLLGGAGVAVVLFKGVYHYLPWIMGFLGLTVLAGAFFLYRRFTLESSDIGRFFSVNRMVKAESYRLRLESEEGLSFIEFNYMLLQAYDFMKLADSHGCLLQMGGSDQWGNIVTGTELVRRKDGGQAWAITTPLIKQADGSKFGKTAEGNVWLDPERTSPYKFYQYWINSADDDVKNYIRIFTLKTKEEIDSDSY